MGVQHVGDDFPSSALRRRLPRRPVDIQSSVRDDGGPAVKDHLTDMEARHDCHGEAQPLLREACRKGEQGFPPGGGMVRGGEVGLPNAGVPEEEVQELRQVVELLLRCQIGLRDGEAHGVPGIRQEEPEVRVVGSRRASWDADVLEHPPVARQPSSVGECRFQGSDALLGGLQCGRDIRGRGPARCLRLDEVVERLPRLRESAARDRGQLLRQCSCQCRYALGVPEQSPAPCSNRGTSGWYSSVSLCLGAC